MEENDLLLTTEESEPYASEPQVISVMGEVINIESDEAFPAQGQSNEQMNHALMYGRDLSDQHPIESITGLKTELKNIKALKPVRSNLNGQADYYLWGETTYIGPGLFVELRNDQIYKCTGIKVAMDELDLAIDADGNVIVYATLDAIKEPEVGKYYIVGMKAPYDIYVRNTLNYAKNFCYYYDGHQIIKYADVFGVTVSNAGFIGDDLNIIVEGVETTSSAKANKAMYSLVKTTGMVDVLCDIDVHVGDYVEPTANGRAKRATDRYGYLVTEIIDDGYGATYARISLSASSSHTRCAALAITDLQEQVDSLEVTLIDEINKTNEAFGSQIQEELKDFEETINDKVDNINSGAIADANAKADMALELMRQTEQLVTELRDETIEQVNKAVEDAYTARDEAEALFDKMEPIASYEYVNEHGEFVTGATGFVDKVDEDGAILAALSKTTSENSENIAGVITKTSDIKASVEALATRTDNFQNSIANLEVSVNEEGPIVKALASKVNKHAVGEYSQAYGLGQNQAADMLIAGETVFIPTIDGVAELYDCIELEEAWTIKDKKINYVYYDRDSKTYYYYDNIYENDWISTQDPAVAGIKQEFTKRFVYVWNGKKWVDSGERVLLYENTPPNLDVYWLTGQAPEEPYKAGALYKKINDAWTEIATIDSNAMSRSASLLTLAQNNWNLSAKDMTDRLATIEGKVGENGASVGILASVMTEVTGAKDKLETETVNIEGVIYTQAKVYDSLEELNNNGPKSQEKYYAVGEPPYDVYRYDGVNYVQCVGWKYDGYRVLQPNAASIISSVNNQGDSVIKMDADYIDFEAENYTIHADKINFEGSQFSSKMSQTYSTKSETETAQNAAITAANNSTDEKLKSYSTTTQMNSVIDQKANAITLSVSQTYSTKDAVATAKQEAITEAANNVDDKLEDYSTTAQMNSAINQKADGITLSVSQTYSTKTETDNAKNAAITSANNTTTEKLKNYSTTAEVEAKIKVEADKIDLKVSKGEVISSINITPEEMKISADKINLEGYATFTDLSTNGKTTINGDNITTGYIDAHRIDADSLSAVVADFDIVKTNSIESKSYGKVINWSDGKTLMKVNILLSPGLYDVDDKLIASWDELNIDCEKDYTNTDSTIKTKLATYPTGSKLVISDKIKRIGNYAFYSCNTLTEIIIPRVEYIGKYSFNLGILFAPSNLETVVLGEGLKEIDSSAFATNVKLKNIIIPKSIETIGYGVFNLCNAISNVYYKGSLADWNNIYIDSMGSANEYFTSATRYYYSETKPVDIGNYWYGLNGFKISSNENDNMITSSYFKVTQDGKIDATSGYIGGWEIADGGAGENILFKRTGGENSVTTGMAALSNNDHVSFWAGCPEGLTPWEYDNKYGISNSYSDIVPFFVTSQGHVQCLDLKISGSSVVNQLKIGDSKKSSIILQTDADTGDGSISVNTGVGSLSFKSSNAKIILGKPFSEIISTRIGFQITNYKRTTAGWSFITANLVGKQSVTVYCYEYSTNTSRSKGYSFTFDESYNGQEKTLENLIHGSDPNIDFPFDPTFSHEYLGFSLNSMDEAEERAKAKGVGIAYSGEISYYTTDDGEKWVDVYDMSSTGVDAIQIEGHVVPVDTEGKYSLGSTNHPWLAVVAKTIGSDNMSTSTLSMRTGYSESDIIEGSDQNKKNTITDLSSQYSTIFDSLRPVTFRYNNGESGRLHTGFIAQEVRDATLNSGLTTRDFAAYCEWEEGEGEDKTTTCGLRYSEFIALCVDQIQKLKARVSELEDIIKTQQKD